MSNLFLWQKHEPLPLTQQYLWLCSLWTFISCHKFWPFLINSKALGIRTLSHSSLATHHPPTAKSKHMSTITKTVKSLRRLFNTPACSSQWTRAQDLPTGPRINLYFSPVGFLSFYSNMYFQSAGISVRPEIWECFKFWWKNNGWSDCEKQKGRRGMEINHWQYDLHYICWNKWLPFDQVCSTRIRCCCILGQSTLSTLCECGLNEFWTSVSTSQYDTMPEVPHTLSQLKQNHNFRPL